jgi:hypothetical protein
MPVLERRWASVDPATMPHVIADHVPGLKSDALNLHGMRHADGPAYGD